MKSAIYTKAGQVGLAELIVRRSRQQMMLLSELSVPVFVDPTSGVTAIQTLKRDIEIVVMRLSE